MAKAKKKRPAARYTAELGEEICRRLAAGEPLVEICRSRGMPDRRTVARWRTEVEGFGAEFLLAREEGCEAIVAEVLRIADHPLPGDKLKIVGERTEITRADMLGHRKLQIDTRLKLLARWKGRGKREAAREEAVDPVRELMLELRGKASGKG